MPLPDEMIIPQFVDAIFMRADSDPSVYHVDTDQVAWAAEERRMVLTRLGAVGCYILEVYTVDTVVTSNLYIFNGTGIIKTLFDAVPAEEAIRRPSFILDAKDSPYNDGPVTEEDEDEFFDALFSGLPLVE